MSQRWVEILLWLAAGLSAISLVLLCVQGEYGPAVLVFVFEVALVGAAVHLHRKGLF